MTLTSMVRELVELGAGLEDDYRRAFKDEPPNPDALAVFSCVLRDLIDDLRALKRTVAADLYAETGHATLQVPELGPVKISRSKSYVKVRYDELIPSIVSRLADSPGVLFDEDGTRLPTHESASRLARGLLACVSMGGVKRPGLAALGLDVDEYAEVKSEATLSMPRRQL